MSYYKQFKSLPVGAEFINGRYYKNGYVYEKDFNCFGEVVYYRHKFINIK